MELEKKNFEFAGNVLAEVWTNTIIEEFPTVAQFFETEGELDPECDYAWRNKHLPESQYFLQIIKCTDRSCCDTPRSLLYTFMERFMPPPMPLQQSPEGLAIPERSTNFDHNVKFAPLLLVRSLDVEKLLPHSCCLAKQVTYDMFCPSLHTKLTQRCCESCGLYHASVKSLNMHSKIHQSSSTTVHFVAQRQRPL